MLHLIVRRAYQCTVKQLGTFTVRIQSMPVTCAHVANDVCRSKAFCATSRPSWTQCSPALRARRALPPRPPRARPRRATCRPPPRARAAPRSGPPPSRPNRRRAQPSMDELAKMLLLKNNLHSAQFYIIFALKIQNVSYLKLILTAIGRLVNRRIAGLSAVLS